MKISELLADCHAGTMQSVGNMAVIPLISDVVDEDFVSPLQVGAVSNKAYGEMTFRNPTDKVMVTPAHVGYLTKKAAQDHAMAGAGWVPKKSSRTFDKAQCVEQTQGGYMSEETPKTPIMLPLALRGRSLTKRQLRSYDKLWQDIGQYSAEFDLPNAAGHIKFFFEQYKQQLDRFISEFEPVPRQVGAIVLINGQVVGIERSPNHAYWLSIWQIVIRDCYGSEAMRVARHRGSLQAPLRVPLKECDTLAELQDALEEAEKEERELASRVVNETAKNDLLENEDERTLDTDTGLRLALVTLGQPDRGVYGQTVLKHGVPIYTSLVAVGSGLGKRYMREFTM